MLVAQSSEFLIKYDLHAGFAGYYQSPFFSQIYDLHDLVSTHYVSAGRLLLLAGSPIIKTRDDDESLVDMAAGTENEGCCIEVVNEESNTLVLKLIVND
jgi:hypothetical protein